MKNPKYITEQDRLVEIMSNLSTRFASIYGIDFFNQVCKHISDVLDVEYTFVGKFIAEEKCVKVIAGIGGGKPLKPFEYELADTPCANVIGMQACIYSTGVQKLFPKDLLLEEMGIESYVGIPLYRRSGEPIGIFVSLGTHEIVDEQLAIAMLTGYSERVSAEIDRADAEEALQKSEQKFRISFDEAPIGIAVLGLDGKFIDTNKAWAHILGYSKEELLTKKMTELTHPDDIESSIKLFKKYVDREISSIDVEKRYTHKSGHTVWGHIRANMIVDSDGKPLYSIAQIEDITERKRAVAAEERLLAIIDTTTDFVGIADSSGKTIYVNEAIRGLKGIKNDDDITKYTIADFHPEWAAKIVLEEGVPEAIKTGSWQGETAFIDASGNEVPVSQILHAHNRPDGGVEYLSTIARDISGSKRAEEELRESERSLARAQEMAHLGSWTLDLLKNELTWSKEIERIYNVSRKTPMSFQELLEFVYPEDKEFVVNSWTEAMEGAPYDVEYRIVIDGRVKWVRVKAKIEKDDDGVAVRGVGIVQDITERKESEEALRQKDKEIRKTYVDVFSAVTEEKLLILTDDEINEALGEPIGKAFELLSFKDLAESREFLRSKLLTLDLEEDQVENMIMVAGEATANGVKHADSSVMQVFTLNKSIQIKVSDHGNGIDFSDLPKATLLAGFSTKKTLGMGFSIILEVCDRVLLSTGSDGTTVVMETDISSDNKRTKNIFNL